MWRQTWSNSENFKYSRLNARGTQPPRKLAASATKALCKCLMTKNYLFREMGGGGGNHTCPRSHVILICALRIL
jgi:hypothetical protein